MRRRLVGLLWVGLAMAGMARFPAVAAPAEPAGTARSTAPAEPAGTARSTAPAESAAAARPTTAPEREQASIERASVEQASGEQASGRDGSGPGGSLLPSEEARLDQLTAEVADQLRCPVCRNQSVLESPAELARRMQAVIRERLAAGQSPEQVKAYFVDRYGEWILLQPTARGINWAVYLLPVVVVLGGALLLRSRFRAWRAARLPATVAAPGPRVPRETGGEGEPIRSLSEQDEAWLDEAIRSG